MKFLKIIVFFMAIMFLISCQSRKNIAKDITPPTKSIIKITPYSSLLKEFDQIKKPEVIKPKFVSSIDNTNFILCDPNNANYVLLDSDEYFKISELVNLTKKYKLIILKYDDLLNKQNDQLLTFRELVNKENNKVMQYYSLLQTNIALLENCEQELDEANRNTIFSVIGLGSVILLLVAL